MSGQEIGKLADGLMRSGLMLYVLILLKRKQHKFVVQVFWIGLFMHFLNLILALLNHSWISVVYISCIAYSIYIYTNNPATPK